MIKTITLMALAGLILLISGCSHVPQSKSGQRSTSYAYRVQKPQHQTEQKPQVLQQQEQQLPVASQQMPQQSNHPLSSPAREQMVGIIKTTLGTPYKWGGNNPQRGFDCSGLMSYVHKNAGLKIPRTTANQRDNSRTIDYAQLQPGDMLFFKTGKKTNHVGMYIGNRKFIHAPSSGKHVTVASMDSSYWYKRFVKFGTYLN